MLYTVSSAAGYTLHLPSEAHPSSAAYDTPRKYIHNSGLAARQHSWQPERYPRTADRLVIANDYAVNATKPDIGEMSISLSLCRVFQAARCASSASTGVLAADSEYNGCQIMC